MAALRLEDTGPRADSNLAAWSLCQAIRALVSGKLAQPMASAEHMADSAHLSQQDKFMDISPNGHLMA
jgi:hypothetical protein